MPITQWNTNFNSGYDADLQKLLKSEENEKLANPNSSPSIIAQQLKPYFDGSIAIGYEQKGSASQYILTNHATSPTH